MTIYCVRCNGVGYTAVRNGDDDQECEACEGSGLAPVNTVAALEPLSELAQLRLDLAAVEAAEANTPVSKPRHMPRIQEDEAASEALFTAINTIRFDIVHKLHLLFDEIGRLQSENDTLINELAHMKGNRSSTTP